MKVEAVAQIIKSKGTDLLTEGPVLFDEFTKDGKKSVAFRMSFQSMDKTLSDEEVNEIMNLITKALEENQGWQVR